MSTMNQIDSKIQKRKTQEQIQIFDNYDNDF